MGGGIKFKLAAFILAFASMVALVIWSAHTSWTLTGELGERLTAVQLKSFQIADHLQQTIWELNDVVLRYGVYQNSNDWAHFEAASKSLDDWIDQERPLLTTEHERQILDLINLHYDHYLDAARRIKTNVHPNLSRSLTPLLDLTAFEQQSRRILNLGSRLAKAHLESMDTFLAESKKSLTYLRILLLTSLALLLVVGGGLAVVIYGELIGPLKVKLVQSQAIMERQEKLASLGMLAAGVAHEIRNPLTAIKTWLFIQQKHLPVGTREFADAEVIASEVSRLERIVKEVLLFARPSEPHLVIKPADEPLRQVHALLSPQLQQANIQLLLKNSVSAKIRIDPQQIQQVLINLIQNGAESIGQNGSVSLRLRLDTVPITETPSNVVILEVEDTGKGIPPEVERRLFDPFFTTKESGTGLGLSIAARIVEKHGGALQYQTQLNHGTTFGIVLPRVL